MQGILQRFREDKGYGFIKVEGRGDVFVGHKEAKKYGIGTLIVGQLFQFDVKMTAVGKEHATNLRVLGAVPKLEKVPEIAAAGEIPIDWETAIQSPMRTHGAIPEIVHRVCRACELDYEAF